MITRIVQISVIVVAVVVARHIFLRWLKQPDTLPQLLREAFEAVFGYFVYVTAGMLIFSVISRYGFGGPLNTLLGFVIAVAGALYVGVGIWALWRFLGARDRRPKR